GGWLITIVCNVCYAWFGGARPDELQVTLEEECHGTEGGGSSPEVDLLRNADAESLKDALERLPVGLREAIVIRELEGISYAEIAAVADIPIGTVMSRLSRGRRRLQECLRVSDGKEV